MPASQEHCHLCVRRLHHNKSFVALMDDLKFTMESEDPWSKVTHSTLRSVFELDDKLSAAGCW